MACLVSYFDMERIVLQYHDKSACQSPGEQASSRFEFSVKVEHTSPHSITVPDHLREGRPVLVPFGYFGVTLQYFERFSPSLENEY